jgi:hypothetical protein
VVTQSVKVEAMAQDFKHYGIRSYILYKTKETNTDLITIEVRLNEL